MKNLMYKGFTMVILIVMLTVMVVAGFGYCTGVFRVVNVDEFNERAISDFEAEVAINEETGMANDEIVIATTTDDKSDLVTQVYCYNSRYGSKRVPLWITSDCDSAKLAADYEGCINLNNGYVILYKF